MHSEFGNVYLGIETQVRRNIETPPAAAVSRMPIEHLIGFYICTPQHYCMQKDWQHVWWGRGRSTNVVMLNNVHTRHKVDRITRFSVRRRCQRSPTPTKKPADRARRSTNTIIHIVHLFVNNTKTIRQLMGKKTGAHRIDYYAKRTVSHFGRWFLLSELSFLYIYKSHVATDANRSILFFAIDLMSTSSIRSSARNQRRRPHDDRRHVVRKQSLRWRQSN